MPKQIRSELDIQVGDFYEDCGYHPCLCTSVSEDDEVTGISLVDGSSPRSCSPHHCGLRLLTVKEAIYWKFNGPPDEIIDEKHRWW